MDYFQLDDFELQLVFDELFFVFDEVEEQNLVDQEINYVFLHYAFDDEKPQHLFDMVECDVHDVQILDDDEVEHMRQVEV